MLCTLDQTELRVAERRGVEIDYWPRCRGVWLDRGELDKILEREAADVGADRVPRDDLARPLGPDRAYEYRDPDRGDYLDQDERRGGRRGGGWLGDLFDFGD